MVQHRQAQHIIKLAVQISARENVHAIVNIETFFQSHEAGPEQAASCGVNPKHRLRPASGAKAAKEAIGATNVEDRFSSEVGRHLHRVPFVDAKTLAVGQLRLTEYLVVGIALEGPDS